MTYAQQLDSLYESMRSDIIMAVENNGEPITIPINIASSIGNATYFKVDRDFIITDIKESINYSILCYEQLAELTDWLKTKTDLKELENY